MPKDTAKALSFFRLSSDLGYYRAHCDVAHMLWNGHGCSPSWAGALRAYRKAARDGPAWAADFPPNDMNIQMTIAQGQGNQRLLETKIKEVCPHLGHRVELYGLTNAALNGAVGKAVDFGELPAGCHGTDHSRTHPRTDARTNACTDAPTQARAPTDARTRTHHHRRDHQVLPRGGPSPTRGWRGASATRWCSTSPTESPLRSSLGRCGG